MFNWIKKLWKKEVKVVEPIYRPVEYMGDKPLRYIKQFGTAAEYHAARRAGGQGQGEEVRRIATIVARRNS